MRNLRPGFYIAFCLYATMLRAYSQDASTLKMFTTDYCTAYVEGTFQRPGVWKHCCLEHDLYFWAGGTYDDRKATDLRLGRCVDATGEHEQARLMYSAVALGGLSPIKFKGQYFGNGWPLVRPRYQKLTRSEIEKLILELESNARWLPTTLLNSFKTQLNSRLE